MISIIRVNLESYHLNQLQKWFETEWEKPFEGLS